MNKLLVALPLLFSLCNIGNAQEFHLLQFDNPCDYIEDLLEEGFYTADLMTGSVGKERQGELLQKMFSHVQDNYDWYVDFVKESKNGFPDKYDSKLGLTPEEFLELKGLIDNYKMSSEGTFTFEVSKSNRKIKFYTTGGPGGFADIQIDLDKEVVRFAQYEMQLSDTVFVENAENRIGSKWEGVQFSYVYPEGISMDNLAKMLEEEEIIKVYRLTIGELIPSSQVYLSIKGIELENGLKKGEFTFPIFLTKR